MSNNHSVGGEHKQAVLFICLTLQQLILSDLHDVTVTQVLNDQAVREGGRHLIVLQLLQLLVVEQGVQEIKRLRLHGRLGLLGLINLRGRPWCARLSLVFNVSLVRLKSRLLLLVFFDDMRGRIGLDHFLRVPHLLDGLNEDLRVVLESEPEIGLPYLLVTDQSGLLGCLCGCLVV